MNPTNLTQKQSPLGRPQRLFRTRVCAALLASTFLCTGLNSQAQTTSDVLAPYAEQVEAAVTHGLDYLTGAQQTNGRFPGGFGDTPGVVSLCGMAFLAAGHTPGRGPYGATINRCIDFALREQDNTGYIQSDSNKSGAEGMYSHSISTLFLSEVSGMVDPERQRLLDVALPKAIGIILSAQNKHKSPSAVGGWRYEPWSGNSDLSCSGWALMALRSARLNGARIPDVNIERAVHYILTKQNPDTGSFGYQVPNGNSISLTGLAVLCLELSGYHESDEMTRATEMMSKNFTRIHTSGHREYALYYNAQAAFQRGEALWESFAHWMYTTYLPRQNDNGAWSPYGWASKKGDRPYATAMMILSFTVPYRQLPIYQRDETIDEDY